MITVRQETQASPVAAPVEALVSVTRPILAGVLNSIAEEYIEPFGERGEVPLKMLGKLRTEGDGDCGIAFEYAVHQAIRENNSDVSERVSDALKRCNIKQGDPSSILFAIEKQGSKQLISTDMDLITEDSSVLSGKRGRPVKLKGQMNILAAAFRRPGTRENLPQGIRGLWKADLFLGATGPDKWVGTSVKINPKHLEGAAGLRVAIVPAESGHKDTIRKDDAKNLIVCPVPYDKSYMETFYSGWRLVQSLCLNNFKMPKPVFLPTMIEREVAKIYCDRRDFSVEEVLGATELWGQPHLIKTDVKTANANDFSSPSAAPKTSTIVTPFPYLGSS